MRRPSRALGIALLVAAVGLTAAACGGSSKSSSSTGASSTPTKGGTYRVATVDFGFTNAFDPTGEYLGAAWGYYSNLLLRTLLTYRHVAGTAGNQPVPDMATQMPTISPDGLTYTFHLKSGIKFGPPVNRAVTSKDIVYSFERIGTKALVAQYAFYYGVIKGFDDFLNGKAKTISGIDTPNDSTIVFHLTQKTGDFLYRLTLPATAPIPQEVAKCFTKPGEYGRYVIATGPYMIQGSDKLAISSCSAMKPISGFDPTRSLILVRNPNYDPATDSPTVRQSFPDEFSFTIDTNEQDIFNRIEKGNLEGSPDTPTPDVLRKYATTSSLHSRLQINSGDRTWYGTMNLTQAPFDDIHVRKAVNYILDKAAMQRAWGGAAAGSIATHIVPDSMFNGQFPKGYDPYASPGSAGDLAKAQAEMKLSKYDPKKDGLCDVSACKNIFAVTRNAPPWTTQEPAIEQSLAKIGITLNMHELPSSSAYTTIQTVSKNVPIAFNAGWGKDFADPGTFMVLFQSATIIPTGNSNYALVSITDAQAKQLGVKLPAGGVPSVDADIAKCEPLTATARTQCWIALDKRLMEQIVPWVPYLSANNIDILGPAVSKYSFDQFSGEAGYAHVAVDTSKQQ